MREGRWGALSVLLSCYSHQFLGADSVLLGDTSHRELQIRPILPGHNIREFFPIWANILNYPMYLGCVVCQWSAGKGAKAMTDKVGVVRVAFDTRHRIRRSYSAVMPTPRSQCPFPDSATKCRIKSVPKRTWGPTLEKRGVGSCSVYLSSNTKAPGRSSNWPKCGSQWPNYRRNHPRRGHAEGAIEWSRWRSGPRDLQEPDLPSARSDPPHEKPNLRRKSATEIVPPQRSELALERYTCASVDIVATA